MKAIIFDLDGTLWDSTDSVAILWNKVLERHEDTPFRLDGKGVKGLFGRTMSEIGEKLFSMLPQEKRKAYMKECEMVEVEGLYETGAILYPELEDTLKELMEYYELYIVSNCQDGYIEAFLHAHRLEKYFKDYEMYGRTGLEKSDNIRLLMERNHITEAVYVGDTLGDEASAHQAGISFIHAAYGFGTAASPDGVIERFSQLPSAAKRLL